MATAQWKQSHDEVAASAATARQLSEVRQRDLSSSLLLRHRLLFFTLPRISFALSICLDFISLYPCLSLSRCDRAVFFYTLCILTVVLRCVWWCVPSWRRVFECHGYFFLSFQCLLLQLLPSRCFLVRFFNGRLHALSPLSSTVQCTDRLLCASCLGECPPCPCLFTHCLLPPLLLNMTQTRADPSLTPSFLSLYLACKTVRSSGVNLARKTNEHLMRVSRDTGK